MKKLAFISLTLLLLISSAHAKPNRTVNPRLWKASQIPLCTHEGECYEKTHFSTPAYVDIDDGYLRVYKKDVEGKVYVFDKLTNGQEVFIIRGAVMKGKKIAFIFYTKTGKWDKNHNPYAPDEVTWVDMRYLR